MGSAAEIGAAHLGVGAEGGGIVLEDDAAGLHDIAAVGHFEGEIGVLFDEQDGDAALAIDLGDLLEDGFDEQRGDAEGGFVEHEEAGAAHEGAADGEHLLFAAGEGSGDLAVPFLQAREQRKHVVELVSDGVTVALEVRAHEEVFAHAEVGEDHAALGHVAQAEFDDFVRGKIGDGLAVEDDGAGAGADEAGEGAEGGAFAGSVGADEGDDFAGCDAQGDAVEGADGAVVDVEIPDFEVAHGSRACSSPR